MRREILASYGVTFPSVPGKKVRFFQEDGASTVEAEVFADGGTLPEWSVECDRLEQAVAAVCAQYKVGLPVPAQRAAVERDVW